MAKPKPRKAGALHPPPLRVLPMQLQLGDRLSDERASGGSSGDPIRPWRQASTFASSPSSSLAVTDIRSWGAHERVAVRRDEQGSAENFVRDRRAVYLRARRR